VLYAPWTPGSLWLRQRSAISAPLWKYEFVAAGDFAQGLQPFDHRRRQRDRQWRGGLGALGRQPPHRTQIRRAIEIELTPLGSEQFAFAHTECQEQFDRQQIGTAETRRVSQRLEQPLELVEPKQLRKLLDVLHLLAHLFNEHFHINRGPGGFDILRLR
jgi:hypothetical protein